MKNRPQKKELTKNSNLCYPSQEKIAGMPCGPFAEASKGACVRSRPWGGEEQPGGRSGARDRGSQVYAIAGNHNPSHSGSTTEKGNRGKGGKGLSANRSSLRKGDTP